MTGRLLGQCPPLPPCSTSIPIVPTKGAWWACLWLVYVAHSHSRPTPPPPGAEDQLGGQPFCAAPSGTLTCSVLVPTRRTLQVDRTLLCSASLYSKSLCAVPPSLRYAAGQLGSQPLCTVLCSRSILLHSASLQVNLFLLHAPVLQVSWEVNLFALYSRALTAGGQVRPPLSPLPMRMHPNCTARLSGMECMVCYIGLNVATITRICYKGLKRCGTERLVRPWTNSQLCEVVCRPGPPAARAGACSLKGAVQRGLCTLNSTSSLCGRLQASDGCCAGHLCGPLCCTRCASKCCASACFWWMAWAVAKAPGPEIKQERPAGVCT